MTGKFLDTSTGGFLILILPIAFLIIFLFSTWPVLLALLVLGAIWNSWQRYQWQQWSQQVNPIFHKLILENRGSITPLDLAMKTNFSAATAKRYLDIKAEEFGAQRQDDRELGRVYYFITARTLGSIFDDSEPASLPSGKQDEIDFPLLSNQNQLPPPEDSIERGSLGEEPISLHMPPSSPIPAPSEAPKEQVEQPFHKQSTLESLLQSELAKRLDVHSSTVYKRRADPDFPEWSRSKDPEGIAWKYSPDTKQFSPLQE